VQENEHRGDPAVLADVVGEADVPVAAQPAPVCEVCAHNPRTITVTNHKTGRHNQYCHGCYFGTHPTIETVEWP
jgi:hypothetical protein